MGPPSSNAREPPSPALSRPSNGTYVYHWCYAVGSLTRVPDRPAGRWRERTHTPPSQLANPHNPQIAPGRCHAVNLHQPTKPCAKRTATWTSPSSRCAPWTTRPATTTTSKAARARARRVQKTARRAGGGAFVDVRIFLCVCLPLSIIGSPA